MMTTTVHFHNEDNVPVGITDSADAQNVAVADDEDDDIDDYDDDAKDCNERMVRHIYQNVCLKLLQERLDVT